MWCCWTQNHLLLAVVPCRDEKQKQLRSHERNVPTLSLLSLSFLFFFFLQADDTKSAVNKDFRFYLTAGCFYFSGWRLMLLTCSLSPLCSTGTKVVSAARCARWRWAWRPTRALRRNLTAVCECPPDHDDWTYLDHLLPSSFVAILRWLAVCFITNQTCCNTGRRLLPKLLRHTRRRRTLLCAEATGKKREV